MFRNILINRYYIAKQKPYNPNVAWKYIYTHTHIHLHINDMHIVVYTHYLRSELCTT